MFALAVLVVVCIAAWVANVTPTTKKRYHPCSCCCLPMHCGYDGDGFPIWPTTLSFVASIAGACPTAAATVVSGTLSANGDAGGGVDHFPTCTSLAALGCETGWPDLCRCEYYWEVDPADIPACGPYIHNVTMSCLPPAGDYVVPDATCPHVRRDKCLWYITIDVYRALYLTAPPHGCRTNILTHITTCPAQDCETCLWVDTDFPEGAVPDDLCCPTCPPCYLCPSHNAQRCADGIECCGTDGCSACVCPDVPPCTGHCFPCSHCTELIPSGGGEPDDSGCECGGGGKPIRYHYWVRGCDDPDDIKGCNPSSCPPDGKNTGNFYLKNGCSDSDYIEVSC